MSGRRGGFLIEIMIAVAIIATSLLAIYGGVSTEMIRAANTNRRRIAKNLAQTKLSEVLRGEESGSSGEFDDYNGFSWDLDQQSYDIGVRQVIQLRLKVSFPLEDENGDEQTEELEIISYKETE